MLDEHDPAAAAAIFAAMAQAGTYYVPTHLTRWVDAYADDPAVREDPLLRYLHPLMRWQWLEDVDATLARDPSPEARETYRRFHRKGLELTGQAHRAGVKVLAGTDYIVAGADLHRELQQLVEAGLSPGAALRAATLDAAGYFGLEGRHGSIAPGNVADLVLLGGNPLTDIRNTERIEAVIFNGALYDRAALDGLQRHVERRARSFSVACKILWRFIKNPVAY
jgi:imidazolonepropionase-like amidohydrolase